ncbi:MAG: methylated-DNA--[protein]-cysteine S-methyltransferase [Firmicutes bacterium]|nr:methylated-DNA--[protein]-cysteine S-methyltransferase [Bacillota bacterium]
MRAWMFQTSAGWITAACSDAGLSRLTLPEAEQTTCERKLFELAQAGYVNQPPGPANELYHLAEALNEYFAGRRRTLDFTVDWSVYKPFQRDILKVVMGIPRGKLLTYGQTAALAGYPRAARAAGGALRTNRTPLVIPCHRVVQRDGSPGGFGGRPWIKVGLLTLEGVEPGPDGRYRLDKYALSGAS